MFFLLPCCKSSTKRNACKLKAIVGDYKRRRLNILDRQIGDLDNEDSDQLEIDEMETAVEQATNQNAVTEL